MYVFVGEFPVLFVQDLNFVHGCCIIHYLL